MDIERMDIERISHEFKSKNFVVEMKICQGKIQFEARNQQQNYMMVAQYSDSNIPSKIKVYFENIKQLFFFLRENSNRVECVSGVGLKTLLHISQQNIKQIVIPLEMISLPQNSNLQKLYAKAQQTIKELHEQNQILKKKLQVLTHENLSLHQKVLNLQEQNGSQRRQKQQMKGKMPLLQPGFQKAHQKKEKPNYKLLRCPFDPDTSITANDIQVKENVWIKKGRYGCLLVNKNPFIFPVSSIGIKIVKSKFKGIYIGVLRQYKEGRQPQWAGSKSAFLQMEGGKRGFKDWIDYTQQTVQSINQGETISITVNQAENTITWSRNMHTICICEAPKTNLYAFIRLKQEGDSLIIM